MSIPPTAIKPSPCINSIPIHAVTQTKDLSLIVNADLTYSSHISDLKRKCSFSLDVGSNVLTCETLICILNCNIISKNDYAGIIVILAIKSQRRKFDRIDSQTAH